MRIVSDVEKKGHPKAACTVKIVPEDEEKSIKQALSTKSALSKTSSKDVGKMLSSINNALIPRSVWSCVVGNVIHLLLASFL